MSRSRWTPFVFAFLAGAATWLAWRFLPRDLFARCCGEGGAHSQGRRRDAQAPPPGVRRPSAADPGSAEARVVEPSAGEAAATEAPAEVGATQAEDPARCAAETQTGTRCSREVEPGTIYCWQHGG